MAEAVLYICNRQKCGEKCGDHCEHTADIEYARNFKIAHEDDNKRIWVEIDAQPEIVRCKDCKRRPYKIDNGELRGFAIAFPEDGCPCECEDSWYNWIPKDDWFCANGERKDDNG